MPQDLLVPVLFRLMREDLTPAPCGFWKGKGHVPLASPSSESILCRDRFFFVLNSRDGIDASMELAVCQAPAPPAFPGAQHARTRAARSPPYWLWTPGSASFHFLTCQLMMASYPSRFSAEGGISVLSPGSGTWEAPGKHCSY